MAFEVKNFAASFYLGSTTRGLASAVFFDTNFAQFNGYPPVCLVTGAPGSGKTFLAQTLCAQAAISGKMVVVIDPKADFVSMKEIENDIGKVTPLNLSPRTRRGIIDPFVICGDNRELGISLAKEILIMFSGRPERELPIEVIDPMLADVAMNDNACMGLLKEMMRGYNSDTNPGQAEQVRRIGVSLEQMSNQPWSQLAFAEPYDVPNRISMRRGTTVITMLGLTLPLASTPRDEYTINDRLATGIMFLVANYVQRVLSETKTSEPKTLIIDEAWSVIRNATGQKMVEEVALKGRSLNMSLILVTQNASHLDQISDIENTISTFFAFRANGREGNKITELMGLRDPEDPRALDFTNLMGDLVPGECLMKDVRKRYSTVLISRYKKEWAEAFESNPLDRERIKSQKQKRS